MELNDVGKEIPMKVVMVVKAPNGKRLFLFERTDRKPSNIDKTNNIQQLRLFMEKHNG